MMTLPYFRLVRGMAGLLLVMLMPPMLQAEGPQWWVKQHVVSGTSKNDYAPATQGQVKFMAKAAMTEMGANAPQAIQNMVSGWSSNPALAKDYAVATVGQLKAVTYPFYHQLELDLPWTSNAGDDQDYAIATVGQLKNVFNFNLPSLIISPASALMLAISGQSVQFFASGTDQHGNPLNYSGLTWSVTPSGGGTISFLPGSQGAGFVSNGTSGTYTITASNAAATGTAIITVYTPVLTRISVIPSSSLIAQNGVSHYLYLTISGFDQYGQSMSLPSLTQSIQRDGVNDTSLYSVVGWFILFPPEVNGTYTITLTAGAVSGATTVVVYTPALTNLHISPATATIRVGESKSYIASGTDQHGVLWDLSSLTWSVTPVGGHISAGGASADFYTNSSENPTPGDYTITATNGTVSATSTVTVYAPVLTYASISPSSAVMVNGSGYKYFTVTGTDQLGRSMDVSSLIWSSKRGDVDDGSVSLSGSTLQFLPGADGTYTLTGTNGTATVTATVTVYTPALTRLEVTPSRTALLLPTGSVQFTVKGFDQLDNVLTFSNLTWSVSGGGTINNDGLFTANGTAGVYTITATKGGISQMAEITVFTSLNAVANLIAKPRSSRVELNWNAYDAPVGTRVDHYNIYRSPSATGTFSKIDQTTDTTYVDRNLQNGTTYWYRVTAVLVDDYGNQLETLPNTVSGIPAPATYIGPVDIAFIIDNTGSMGSAINNVRSELGDVISDIVEASGNNYRAALVTPDEDTVDVRLTFSDLNGDQLANKLQNLAVGGGGNAPESTDACLNHILNAVGEFQPGFRAGVKKVIILVTDALPGGEGVGADVFVADPTLSDPDSDEYHAHAYALQAQAQGVLIGTVAVQDGASDDPAAFYRIMHDYYAGLTAPTGQSPIYIEVPHDGKGTAAAVMDVIDQGVP